MTRTVPAARAGIALLAAAALALLTGCTAQPGAVPGSGTTVRPAAVTGFRCPPVSEVAALGAVALTASTSTGGTCTYSTADGAAVDASVTVRHPAPTVAGARTLAALRYAAVRRGTATSDAPRLALDAFTAATTRDCTVWFPSEDGVLTSVTARRAGAAGKDSCELATAVASLAGVGTPRPAAPIVSVLGSRRLLGTATADAAWPWRIGRDADVRIDRTTAAGYLRPSAASSFATAVKRVPADSAAVVLVSGTAEAGTPRLEMLSDATAALSAAAARAPKAQLIVVGPVSDGSVAVDDLRADLQAAAGIAGARFVDPVPTGVGASAALDAVADQVSAALRTAGVHG